MKHVATVTLLVLTALSIRGYVSDNLKREAFTIVGISGSQCILTKDGGNSVVYAQDNSNKCRKYYGKEVLVKFKRNKPVITNISVP